MSLSMPAVPVRRVVARLGHERTVAIAVAGIVLGASFLSVGPGRLRRRHRRPDRRRTRRPASRSPPAFDDDDGTGSIEEDYARGARSRRRAERTRATAETRPVARRGHRCRATRKPPRPSPRCEAQADQRRGTVPRRRHAAQAGRGRHPGRRRLRPGQDLQGQGRRHAGRHRPQARRLDDDPVVGEQARANKDDLHRGQVLNIPPVNGLVVEVKAGQTLDELATAHKVTDDRDRRDQRPRRPEPRRRPGPGPARREGRADPDAQADQEADVQGEQLGRRRRWRRWRRWRWRSARPPKTYGGGNFAWPAPGGPLSQYYHYGHYGLDIDGRQRRPHRRGGRRAR